jgi:hypothetical protein
VCRGHGAGPAVGNHQGHAICGLDREGHRGVASDDDVRRRDGRWAAAGQMHQNVGAVDLSNTQQAGRIGTDRFRDFLPSVGFERQPEEP